MELVVKKTCEEASGLAAELVAELVRNKPHCVLGFATGLTPVGCYKELARLHAEEGLDFSKVTTFNLDEYVGLNTRHDQSYRHFMNQNLFNHINVAESNINVPNGMATDVGAYCEWYEREIKRVGGIDIQMLGIGSNGHIAFNEPGSSLGSRTRVKTLTDETRRDNARFFKDMDEVPRYAITMGIGTIMEARELLMIVTGAGKADAVAAAAEGPVTCMCPASMIQLHPKATVIVDEPASKKLKRAYTTEPHRWDFQHRL